MSEEPDKTNPYARRMKEVFDFESRPGLALIRPEIAKQLREAAQKQQVMMLAEEWKKQQALPMQPYHPDDEEDEDFISGPTWYLEWDMWVFILLCALSLAGVWQVAGWLCDLWQWVKGGVL